MKVTKTLVSDKKNWTLLEEGWWGYLEER